MQCGTPTQLNECKTSKQLGQRRAARQANNAFSSTSSVRSELNQLQRTALDSRGNMPTFCGVAYRADIQSEPTYKQEPEQTTVKFIQISPEASAEICLSSHAPFQDQTGSQHQLLRLPI